MVEELHSNPMWSFFTFPTSYFAVCPYSKLAKLISYLRGDKQARCQCVKRAQLAFTTWTLVV